MKLAPAQLAKHLQGGLAPVYIVSGDDPLLCQEAADAIRTAARQQGFDERQVFSADASFDWGTLLQAGASMSLFAEKRLLELRLPSGKPGDKGAAALMEYCSRPAEDTVLLISLPKLDGSAQKTKWGKAFGRRPANPVRADLAGGQQSAAAVDSPAPVPGRGWPQRKTPLS